MIIVNGKITKFIAVADRGLQFGDGLFETMCLINKHPQDLDSHLVRMQNGCSRLQINFPCQWRQEIINASKNYSRNGVLKLILTRGDNIQGLKTSGASPNRIIKIDPMPETIKKFRQQGVKLKICQTRLSCNPATAGLKSLNWLENVLAHLELSTEFYEGLMLNIHGEIIEGISSNFFAIKGNCLLTPDLTHCGLVGITHDKVLAIANMLGMKIVIVAIKDYRDFESCFITNSVIGLYPVIAINKHNFVINDKLIKIQAELI